MQALIDIYNKVRDMLPKEQQSEIAPGQVVLNKLTGAIGLYNYKVFGHDLHCCFFYKDHMKHNKIGVWEYMKGKEIEVIRRPIFKDGTSDVRFGLVDNSEFYPGEVH